MNERPVLEVLLGEFREKIKLLDNLIPRQAQFPKAPNKIRVAIGMRRVGKTYFLYQHIKKLLKEGIDEAAILYINFEDDRLLPLGEKKLAKLVDAFYAIYPENHDRMCYLFFDEIQNVNNWPSVIRRLHDTKQIEIFLTGSSAKLLSKEIATSLRGRSLAIEIWPYSFLEFAVAKQSPISPNPLFDNKTKDKLSKLFQQYLSEGGFPEITSYDPDIKQQTLQEYLDVAIYRDIIERHNVKNPTIIKYMILSMIHNVGRPFAINKFYNDIKSQGFRIGKDQLYDYASHIEDAYLTFSIPTYHPSLSKIQTQPKKLYSIDPGLVRSLTLDYEKDLGRLFENIIYLDLRRQNYRISYYTTSSGYEVDFLAQTPQGKKKLFQVSWDIQDAKTLDREQHALQEGMAELKIDGKLITLDSYLREGQKSLLIQ